MSKVTKEHLDAAEKLAQTYYNEYRSLSDRYADETLLPLAKEMVGKCYSFENGSSATEKWTGYARLISVDDQLRAYTIDIERDNTGRVSARVNDHYISHGSKFGMLEMYKEISEREFNEATRPILDEIRHLALGGRWR